MDDFTRAMGAIFVAAFALQQLIELLDPILDKVIPPGNKKWVLSALTLIVSLLLAFGLNLRVLAALGASVPPVFDAIVTALFITGGTKGINDLLKLIGYHKEAAKSRLTAEQISNV